MCSSWNTRERMSRSYFMNCEKPDFILDHTLAENKEQFRRALQHENFDAILSDYRLPNWTGLEALQELRATGREIPFLLVSGTRGEEAAVECIKQGVTDYILKDQISRLPGALRLAIGEKALREETNQAQDALADSETRGRQQFAELNLLYRSLPVALAVFGCDMRFLRVNDEVARLHPISRTQWKAICGRSSRRGSPSRTSNYKAARFGSPTPCGNGCATSIPCVARTERYHRPQ